MATNSGNNGTAPTTPPEQQQLRAVAEAASGNAIADFMSRVESAAQLLADIGRELGSAGEQDERELMACAEEYRSAMARMVEKIVTRHRRRVGDLERVLGKLTG